MVRAELRSMLLYSAIAKPRPLVPSGLYKDDNCSQTLLTGLQLPDTCLLLLDFLLPIQHASGLPLPSLLALTLACSMDLFPNTSCV